MCSANPKNISSVKNMIHLWYHENMRVFHDRLVNKEDKDLFISECIKIGNTFQNIAKDVQPDTEPKK